MTRISAYTLVLALLTCISNAGAQTTPAPSSSGAHTSQSKTLPTPLALHQKFEIYLKQAYEPQSFLVPAFFAGIDQARNSPKELGQDTEAFGGRLGSIRGQFQIANAAQFGVGAALHEDPRYFSSNLHGSWVRTKYVFKHTYIARMDDGSERLAFALIAGATAGGFAPNGWLPGSQNGVERGFERTAIMLLINLGVNMGREFGPDDKKFFFEKILHRRPSPSAGSFPNANGQEAP